MCENELAIKRPRFDLSYCDLLIFLPSFFSGQLSRMVLRLAYKKFSICWEMNRRREIFIYMLIPNESGKITFLYRHKFG